MTNANSYVQVPIDAGGKKVRDALQTIGSDDVHTQYVIGLKHDRLVTNVYRFCSSALVIGASADGANVGRVYIENDPDSTVYIAIREVSIVCSAGSALATPTSPVIALRRFTFTGNTPSGAAITGSIKDTNMTTKDSNWNVRTAATGMVITEQGDEAQFLVPAVLTASGASPIFEQIYNPTLYAPLHPLILRAGQGLMVKQIDAGTTSDTRRFVVEMEVEEMIPLTVS